MARTIRQSDFAPHDGKNDFVPQDLIEKLTASVDLKQQQQENNQNNRKGFIPRPYLLKFENAIDQIRLLRNDVDVEIGKESAISKQDEANYKSQLSGFMTDLQKIMHDFRILDGGISKVSQTAIRIGDRLENVEEKRQQILDSEELIEHFLSFNKPKKYRQIDPMFFAESGDDLYKAAKLIIKLHEIGTDLTLPETQNARDEITNIANRIKLNLKEEFIRAYQAKREDNYIEMTQCATILDEFNDKEAFAEFLNLYLRDVDFHRYASTSYSDVAKTIVEFMYDLSRVMETAIKSINKVFPKPELVIKDLIIGAFTDQILNYLMNATQPMLVGNVLDDLAGFDSLTPDVSMQRSSGFREANLQSITETSNGGNVNRLSKKELDEYLSIIDIVYKHTNNLLKDLKTKLLEIVFTSADDNDLNHDKRSKLYSIGHILEEDKLLSIVFGKHQSNYLKLEMKHLKNGLKELIKLHVIEALKLEHHDLSDDEYEAEGEMKRGAVNITVEDDELSAFEMSIDENRQVNFLSALKSRTPINSGRKLTKQIMQQTRNYSEKKLKTMKKMLPKSMSSKEFEEMMARLRNVFQFGINECVATIKKKVSVSLKRCINISKATELSGNIHKIFLIYLDAIDMLFRKTLIPICKETLPKKGSKNITHWYFLEAVHHTNSALQLVEQCFLNDVAPSITDTFEYSICKEDKNQIYCLFEADILCGLKDLLSSGLNIIETILKKEQQKSDFKPKQDDITNLSATKACISACQFIDQFRGRSLICLDGRNLDRFFLCLGTRLYYNIIQHFKDFYYNNTGAMILVNDAKKYQDTVKQFHIERINELFLTLVKRTNLICIPSDSIVTIINDDKKLSKIPKNELKQWLKLRTDYKSCKIESKLFD